MDMPGRQCPQYPYSVSLGTSPSVQNPLPLPPAPLIFWIHMELLPCVFFFLAAGLSHATFHPTVWGLPCYQPSENIFVKLKVALWDPTVGTDAF
mmetsp:Transcript_67516/g.119746  ORF Transcript_67516/g.119746 Transcript_67516/m.119746 type:complete len:94 (-) Transcript_67516:1147-1428(-)